MVEVIRVLASEGELLNILYDLSPLEWRKYRQRNPEVWVVDHFERDNCSRLPPYIAFRFERESDFIISTLSDTISSYRGLVSWSLIGCRRYSFSGVNWVIEPARLKEVEAKAQDLGISSEEYLAQYEPDFGPTAFEDLAGLTEYVRQSLLELKNPKQ